MQRDHRLIRLLGGWTAACALLAAAGGCGSGGSGTVPTPATVTPNASVPRSTGGFLFTATADGRVYRVGQELTLTYAVTDQQAHNLLAGAFVGEAANLFFRDEETNGVTTATLFTPGFGGEGGSHGIPGGSPLGGDLSVTIIGGEGVSFTESGPVTLPPGTWRLTCSLYNDLVDATAQAPAEGQTEVPAVYTVTNPITITVLPAAAKPGG